MIVLIETQLIRDQVLKVASKFKDITFVVANEGENESELKLLKLEDSGEDVNVGYFVSNSERYAMEPSDEFDSETLEAFVKNVKAGKISPIVKSSFPPAKNPTNGVWTVVGDTFEKLVTKAKQDILLEFYAPWCGHCKALEPVYKELAEKFQNEPRIRVMKLDATANDYPGHFEIKGFPTIYYIKNRGQLVQYNGERTLAEMSKFIQENLENTPAKDEL